MRVPALGHLLSLLPPAMPAVFRGDRASPLGRRAGDALLAISPGGHGLAVGSRALRPRGELGGRQRLAQTLRHIQDSPKLPHGYPPMVLMADMWNSRFQRVMTDELRRRRLGPFAVEASAE